MSTTHINRLRCSITNTPGLAGNVVVGAATSAARRTFTAAEDGLTFEPTFEQGNAWEVRTGCVYTHATSTLTRGTLVDSSTGAAISLTPSATVGLHGTAKAMQDLEPARAVMYPRGAGTDSLRIGVNATSAGSTSTAVGSFAVSSGANSSAFGYDSRSSGSFSVALGRTSLASQSAAVAIGYASTASNFNATAIGTSASALAGSAVAIGDSSSVALAETGGCAIGKGATVSTGATGGGENIAIGHLSTSSEWRATAVGFKAQATAISATAIGRGALATATHAIAIGRGSWSNVANLIAIGFGGGNTQTDVHFESGHTHKYVDPVDGTTITRTPSLTPIAIHGFDSYDATGSPTNNVAGGPLILAGGRGTGTATGGSVKLQAAPAGGASNNTKNALVTILEALPDGYIFVPNATTIPGSSPVGGGYMYVEAGALKYRGSSGTITTIAPA